MSTRKIDPVHASKCEDNINGWNSIMLPPSYEEGKKITFRSKETPVRRGAIHELADRMMKEGNAP
jgi:hypothetical protein